MSFTIGSLTLLLPEMRNCKPLYYCRVLLQFLLLAVICTSCATIQKNYLGNDRYGISPEFPTPKRLSASEYESLNRNIDSILQTIESQKKPKRSIRALYINQLFTGFGIQIENDRYYNSIIQKSFEGNDSLICNTTGAAAHLLYSAKVYDNTYQKNRIVRRALNRGESGNHIPKRALQKSRTFLYSPRVRKHLKQMNESSHNKLTDSILLLLPPTNGFKALAYRIYRKNDRLSTIIYSVVHAGSTTVGNSVGLFHGKSQQKRNASLLIPYLQPFDIILMKSPRHLTDKLVPGYFGHAAIWLGPEIMKELELLDKTKTGRHKSSISEKSIVEALRTGVRLSSAEEFSDGDDFLVLRLKELPEDRKKTILDNISKQLHKEYDFNFDVESPEALSCTELVYLSYDFIDWQVRYTWSRYYISPDDLPLTAIKSEDFIFPVFLQNENIIENPDPQFLQKLFSLPIR